MSLHDDDLPDDVSFVLDLSEPSEELLKIASQEMEESPDTRACALQDLSDMIYERGDVVPHRMDDAFLLRFLRARHFHVEKAHHLMIKYYNFRENNQELHKDVCPFDENMLVVARSDIVSVLPYRDQLGRRTTLVKLGKWNPSEISIDDMFTAILLIMELAVLEQRAQIVGGVCFFDMENLSLQQAWYVTPSVADKVVQLMGRSFPLRVTEIHVMNQPWAFETMYSMFKPFLNEKLIERIHFHGTNYETLHALIEPKYLPEIYGGTRPPYPQTIWFDSLAKCPAVLKELSAAGYVRCEPQQLKDGKISTSQENEA